MIYLFMYMYFLFLKNYFYLTAGRFDFIPFTYCHSENDGREIRSCDREGEPGIDPVGSRHFDTFTVSVVGRAGLKS